MNSARRWVAAAGRAAALVLLSSILSVCLIRFAPGYGIEEEWLDARRDASRRVTSEAFPVLLGRTLRGYFTGDWGSSRLFQRPVTSLIAERWAPTAAGVAGGLALAWALALPLALAAARGRRLWFDAGTLAAAGLAQCLPAALIGLALLACGARGAFVLAAAVALVLAPRVYRLAHAILVEAAARDCVRAARVRGVGPWRALFSHALPVAWAPLAALAGVSVGQALGAAVPLEMVLDVPGLGQLAWQAALGRDLQLLVCLCALIGLVVIAANAIAETKS